MSDDGYRFYLSPEAKHDLERLHALAARTQKGSPSRRLATVAMNNVLAIKKGAASTHALTFMSSYPDLSDCQTTYVGADPDRKPSHRVVWREMPATDPGDAPLREVIAIGERHNGAVYDIAGQRLGRPVGVSLASLSARPEPIASSEPTREQNHEKDLEFD